ncbi:MAG TPA: Nif3-like dinuclear metal center hexameric protein [Acidimicrobiia bacterium]|nr:Nif3-like dinuclear metal center hexameric protein [Acidimicrobiia bacterium]
MRTVAEFLDALSHVVPGDKAADWDRQGLEVGDANAPVQRVGVCHDITQAVVEDALRQQLDLLITYHPLLFRPLHRLTLAAGPESRAYQLVRGGVAVATVHTAWDVAPGGAADALASAFGLSEVRGFGLVAGEPQVKVVAFIPGESADGVAEAMAAAGAGRIGNYFGCSFRSPGTGTFFPGEGARPVAGMAGRLNYEDEVRVEMVAPKRLEDRVVAALVASHPYEEPAFDVIDVRSNAGLVGRVGRLPTPHKMSSLGELVAASLGVAARLSHDDEALIESLAVLPGSGGSFLGEAAATGADAFLTGDLNHHQFLAAADRGLKLVDPGHAASEAPGLARLREVVAGLGVDTVDLTGNPTPWTT